MPLQEFWDSIAAAHRVVGSESESGRPVLTPDPLESEPESDEEDRTDGIFSPQFMQSTGVQCAAIRFFTLHWWMLGGTSVCTRAQCLLENVPQTQSGASL